MDDSQFNRRVAIVMAVSLVAASLAYAPVVGADFVNYDDDVLVVNNAAVRDFDVVGMFADASVYQDLIPLTLLSFAIEQHLFGLDPFVYHLDNFLLHVANTVLVLFLILGLSGRRLRVAAAVAVLFALHPVNAEAVCWVSERKGLLATFWLLAALNLYLSYARCRDGDGASRRVATLYGLCLACFSLAVLSKPSAMVFPALILLVDMLLDRVSLRNSIDKLPTIAISVAVAAIAVSVRVAPPEGAGMSWDAPIVAIDGFAFYLTKLVVPTELSVYYARELVSVGVGEYLVLASMLIGGGFVAWRWPRHRRSLVFGAGFFIVALAPMLKLVPFARDFAYADRYLYLPALGVFFIVGLLVDALLDGTARRRSTAIAAWACIAAVCVAMLVATHQRSKVWQSSGTLWASVIANYPDTAIAHHNYGLWHLREGRVDDAARHLAMTIQLDGELAEGHYNIGLLHARRGDAARARTHYQIAVDLEPDYVEAHNNLGTILEAYGELKEAQRHYQVAIELSPRYADARLNLGNCYLRQQRLDEAVASYLIAIELQPEMSEAHHNLALVFRAQGKLELALESLHRVLQLHPDSTSAHQQLSEIYVHLGEAEKASRHREQVERTPQR